MEKMRTSRSTAGMKRAASSELLPMPTASPMLAIEDEDVLCRRTYCQEDMSSLLVMCDGCDKQFHSRCAGLSAIPKGDWFCGQCVKNKNTGPLVHACEHCGIEWKFGIQKHPTMADCPMSRSHIGSHDHGHWLKCVLGPTHVCYLTRRSKYPSDVAGNVISSNAKNTIISPNINSSIVANDNNNNNKKYKLVMNFNNSPINPDGKPVSVATAAAPASKLPPPPVAFDPRRHDPTRTTAAQAQVLQRATLDLLQKKTIKHYPTATLILSLIQQTGLSEAQIRAWFTVMRNRFNKMGDAFAFYDSGHPCASGRDAPPYWEGVNEGSNNNIDADGENNHGEDDEGGGGDNDDDDENDDDDDGHDDSHDNGDDDNNHNNIGNSNGKMGNAEQDDNTMLDDDDFDEFVQIWNISEQQLKRLSDWFVTTRHCLDMQATHCSF